MTATKTTTIFCDGEKCGEWEYVNDLDSVREGRKKLRKRGWRHIPGRSTTGPGRDLCPRHAAEQQGGGDQP